MLHACVQRFDVMKNLKKIWELNTTLGSVVFIVSSVMTHKKMYIVDVDDSKVKRLYFS